MEASEKDRLTKKIVDEEGQYIDALAESLLRRSATSREAIAAACELMNGRQRYFGKAGEYFSVQDVDGIDIVDTLDERLLSAIHSVISAIRKSGERDPGKEAMTLLADKLLLSAKQLPPYPVAYMLLYVLREMLEKFESFADQQNLFPLEECEEGIVVHIDNIVGSYVRNRTTPVMRHFGDVAREYSVVNRLKCPCGEEKYEVTMQTLCLDKDGGHYDRLDVTCGNCSRKKTFNFALPNFKDISTM